MALDISGEPFSRAFWDEVCDLEISDIKFKLKFEWISKENLPKEIKTLVLLESSKLPFFIEKAISKSYTLCCKEPKSDISVYSSIKECLVICLCKTDNLNLCGLITELLNDWLKKCNKVITIQIQSKALFKSKYTDLQHSTMFLQGINSDFEYIKELHPPNFISGISASVATWRYLEDLPVSSYVFYTNLNKLDKASAEVVLKFLKTIGLNCEESNIHEQSDSFLYA